MKNVIPGLIVTMGLCWFGLPASAALLTTETKLVPPGALPNDGSGWSVAIDGDTVVVGSLSDDDAGDGSGSASVYVRSKFRLGLATEARGP